MHTCLKMLAYLSLQLSYIHTQTDIKKKKNNPQLKMHGVLHAKQRTSSRTAQRAALERVREKAAVRYCKGAPSSVTGT